MSLQNESELFKIADFKKGYTYYLDVLFQAVNGFTSFLNSSSVTESAKKDLQAIRKVLDTELSKIQDSIRRILPEIEIRNLEPAAKKDYYSYFPNSNLESEKIDYIIFFRIFNLLFEFNSELNLSWNQIKNSIYNTTFEDRNFKTDSLITFRIIPITEKIDTLSVVLVRMAALLGIENPRMIFDKKKLSPKYNSNYSYRLSSLFTNSLEIDKIVTELDDLHPEDKQFQKTNTKEDKKQIPVKKIQEDFVPKGENVLNAGGSFSWNSNYHYFFQYINSNVEEEKKLFASTIKIDTHLGADEEKMKSEFIRSLSSKEVKVKSKEENISEYLKFLNEFFQFCIEITAMNVQIPSTIKNIFIFHLGPSHFYMLVKKFLLEANTGYLHVRSSDGKRVVKMYPNETIKKQIVDFWRTVILPSVEEEKNNLTLLKKIVDRVEQCYKEASLNSIRQYDLLPDAIKVEKSRVSIFREKMNEWMGATNIIVFKRFLKTNIG